MHLQRNNGRYCTVCRVMCGRGNPCECCANRKPSMLSWRGRAERSETASGSLGYGEGLPFDSASRPPLDCLASHLD